MKYILNFGDIKLPESRAQKVLRRVGWLKKTANFLGTGLYSPQSRVEWSRGGEPSDLPHHRGRPRVVLPSALHRSTFRYVVSRLRFIPVECIVMVGWRSWIHHVSHDRQYQVHSGVPGGRDHELRKGVRSQFTESVLGVDR